MSNDERLFTAPTTQFDDLSRSETIATEADNLTFDCNVGLISRVVAMKFHPFRDLLTQCLYSVIDI